SVTDLEIDFGVLSNPEQATRSFFYFREPLPCAQMPGELAARYSDAYAADAAAPERTRNLAALKRRIETSLPGHVRRYAVQWAGHGVTGLAESGGVGGQAVWAQLAAETPPTLGAGDIPWQQAERNALDDFAADRARDFVGRRETLARLINFCGSPDREGAPWA